MTKTLQCIIVDDEQNAIDALRIILTEFIKDIEIIGTANSALDAVKLVAKTSPHIVFLDVDMPGGSGFDFLEAYPDKKFKVIFTTASSVHAIKAVKARAEDYLLKPIDTTELQNTIDKLRNELEQQDIFLEKKISLPIQGGYVLLNYNDIIHIDNDGNYTTFYTKDNAKHLISKNLGYFVEKLNFHPFFRCHQSHIINVNEIKQINKTDGTYCIMSNGNRIDISRAHKDQLFELI